MWVKYRKTGRITHKYPKNWHFFWIWIFCEFISINLLGSIAISLSEALWSSKIELAYIVFFYGDWSRFVESLLIISSLPVSSTWMFLSPVLNPSWDFIVLVFRMSVPKAIVEVLENKLLRSLQTAFLVSLIDVCVFRMSLYLREFWCSSMVESF